MYFKNLREQADWTTLGALMALSLFLKAVKREGLEKSLEDIRGALGKLQGTSEDDSDIAKKAYDGMLSSVAKMSEDIVLFTAEEEE